MCHSFFYSYKANWVVASVFFIDVICCWFFVYFVLFLFLFSFLCLFSENGLNVKVLSLQKVRYGEGPALLGRLDPITISMHSTIACS